MKVNKAMQGLIESFCIDLERTIRDNPAEDEPEIVEIDGCVFLSEEYSRSKSVCLRDFPDRTGYECFVNHIHMPGGSKSDLLKLFERIVALRNALQRLHDGNFEMIISVADEKATLRFHKYRAGERWLNDNLDGYGEEGILAIEVACSPGDVGAK
jgi:hypothetical protein